MSTNYIGADVDCKMTELAVKRMAKQQMSFYAVRDEKPIKVHTHYSCVVNYCDENGCC